MGANSIYIPMAGRAGPPPPPLPTHTNSVEPLSGNGPPDGVVPANPGSTYTDLLTNLLYLKISGTQTTGWQQVGISAAGGGGGGGAAVAFAVLSAAGPPSGSPGVPNAVYTDTLTGNQWWYYNGGWH